ncbi:hypothetical protein ACPV5Q_15360 [Vibrio astriarenae]
MALSLNIESLDGSGDNWFDRDTQMLHASFQLLKDFIEQEKPQDVLLFASLAYNDTPLPESEKAHVTEEECLDKVSKWKQLLALYDWWAEYVSNEDSDGLNEIQRYKLEQSKLLELVELRCLMWC